MPLLDVFFSFNFFFLFSFFPSFQMSISYRGKGRHCFQIDDNLKWNLSFPLCEVISRWLNEEYPTWSCSPNYKIACLQLDRYLQTLYFPLITAIFCTWQRESCAAALDQELWFELNEVAFPPASLTSLPMHCSACIAFLAGYKPWYILCPKLTLAKSIMSAAPLNKINLNILCFQLKFSVWNVSLAAH